MFSINQETQPHTNIITVNPYTCLQINDYFYTIRDVCYNMLNIYNPLLEKESICNLEKGIYTWLIISHNGNPGIFLLKTLSIQEIHTKHSNILQKIYELYPNETYFLHYAGELMKTEDNTLMMNFASGTYMAGNMQNSMRSLYIDEVTRFIQHICKSPSLNIEFVDDDTQSFINNENLKLNMNDLQMYLNCGGHIRRFNSLEECNKYKSVVRQNETLRNRYNYNVNIYEINKTRYPNMKLQTPQEPVYMDENIGILVTPDTIRGGSKKNKKNYNKKYTHRRRKKIVLQKRKRISKRQKHV